MFKKDGITKRRSRNGTDIMTIQWIIDTLKLNGVNSKGQVVKALQEANIDDLRELRMSINETINKKIKGEDNNVIKFKN